MRTLGGPCLLTLFDTFAFLSSSTLASAALAFDLSAYILANSGGIGDTCFLAPLHLSYFTTLLAFVTDTSLASSLALSFLNKSDNVLANSLGEFLTFGLANPSLSCLAPLSACSSTNSLAMLLAVLGLDLLAHSLTGSLRTLQALDGAFQSLFKLALLLAASLQTELTLVLARSLLNLSAAVLACFLGGNGTLVLAYTLNLRGLKALGGL